MSSVWVKSGASDSDIQFSRHFSNISYSEHREQTKNTKNKNDKRGSLLMLIGRKWQIYENHNLKALLRLNKLHVCLCNVIKYCNQS